MSLLFIFVKINQTKFTFLPHFRGKFWLDNLLFPFIYGIFSHWCKNSCILGYDPFLPPNLQLESDDTAAFVVYGDVGGKNGS